MMMPRFDQLPSRTSILSQAAGLGLLLYGMATGAASLVAVGVILSSVAATVTSRKGDTAEG